jgi:hypothetical protein
LLFHASTLLLRTGRSAHRSVLPRPSVTWAARSGQSRSQACDQQGVFQRISPKNALRWAACDEHFPKPFCLFPAFFDENSSFGPGFRKVRQGLSPPL